MKSKDCIYYSKGNCNKLSSRILFEKNILMIVAFMLKKKK